MIPLQNQSLFFPHTHTHTPFPPLQSMPLVSDTLNTDPHFQERVLELKGRTRRVCRLGGIDGHKPRGSTGACFFTLLEPHRLYCTAAAFSQSQCQCNKTSKPLPWLSSVAHPFSPPKSHRRTSPTRRAPPRIDGRNLYRVTAADLPSQSFPNPYTLRHAGVRAIEVHFAPLIPLVPLCLSCSMPLCAL